MADDLANEAKGSVTPWWQPVLFASFAGGMAWGIRGQYGHETGAMIAGLMVSLVLALLLCPQAPSLSLARAVGWGAVAMGIGGSMTYGQTVGLTHDAALDGNWDALRWGMFGLAVKGGIWIGFGGLFLGMGLSEIRYPPVEMFLLMLALLAAHFLGVAALNSPFDPPNRVLPSIYFSSDWVWLPEAELKPRFELWGGLLFALSFLFVYVAWYRNDRLARNLALWGFLGGALGFPSGQSLQAFSAWNREWIGESYLNKLHLNWWNLMETTYGAVMGAFLGLGAWLNRGLMNPSHDEEVKSFSIGFELALLVVHLPLLLAVEFMAIPFVDAFYDLGLILVMIPIVAIAGGRWWPYLQIFPLMIIPIAGKTIRELVYRGEAIAVAPGWLIYGVLPLGLAMILAIWARQTSRRRQEGHAFVRWTLLFATWVYFCLNYAFFKFPWPWAEWTGRTFNGLIFTLCAFGLTALVVARPSRGPKNDDGELREVVV